jgi:glycosyltransferase involved in cell wall biosynthesis
MKPMISVVVPTKNEEVTVSKFIEWCNQGFEKARVTGEIILMDSSTDNTGKIASELGAKVVKVSLPGLGKAYEEAKGHISGEIVILGDADCTYDFREIDKFIESIKLGNDFVIGTRFKGNIEPGSMPIHHRYFGSPLTTYIFSKILKIKVSDIHCGMRAMTTKLYKSLPFYESGWEYASEMIIIAARLGSKISEIPINFYKDLPGRISHQKRNGFLTPFRAGIGTLRIIFTYGLERFILMPALLLSLFGYLLTIMKLVYPEILNRLNIGDLGISIFTMTTLSFFSLFVIGVNLKVANDKTGIYYKNIIKRIKPNVLFLINFVLGLLFSIFTFVSAVIFYLSLIWGKNFEPILTQIWILSFIFIYCLTIFTVSVLHLENLNKKK